MLLSTFSSSVEGRRDARPKAFFQAAQLYGSYADSHGAGTAVLVLFLLVYVLGKGIPHLSWELLSTRPSYLTERIGILPDILNTLYIVVAALGVTIPLGVGAAIYLTEYAENRRVVSVIELAVSHPLYTASWECFFSVSS